MAEAPDASASTARPVDRYANVNGLRIHYLDWARPGSEDKPPLHFAERACVHCGLCAATCPEKVISLVPRLDLRAWSAPRRRYARDDRNMVLAQ